MISMMDKRDNLLALIETLLNAHDPFGDASTVMSASRYRRQTEMNTSRRKRLQVMGAGTGGEHGVWYVEVLPAAREVAQAVSINAGSAIQLFHTYRVSLWFRYQDNDTYASSSEAAWNDMLHATSGTKGLLTSLDETVEVGSSDERAILHTVDEYEEDVVPLDGAASEVAHYCTFIIDIEG